MDYCLYFKDHESALDVHSKIINHFKSKNPNTRDTWSEPFELPNKKWAIIYNNALDEILGHELVTKYKRKFEHRWWDSLPRRPFLMMGGDEERLQKLRKMKLTPLQESLQIIGRLSSEISILNNVLQSENQKQEIKEVSLGYMVIKLHAFLEEWKIINGKKIKADSSFDHNTLDQLTNKLSPAIKKIKSWNGLEKARNRVFAHNFRTDPEKEFLDHREVLRWKIPNTIYEYNILTYCTSTVADELINGFAKEYSDSVEILNSRFLHPKIKGAETAEAVTEEIEKIKAMIND